MMTKRLHHLIIFIILLSAPLIAFATGNIEYVIKGVDPVITKNIESRLDSEQKLIGLTPDSDNVSHFYKNTVLMVHNAITPYGYFSPVVTSSLKRKKSTWIMTYNIKLGEPVIITEVNIDVLGAGQDNPNLQNYLTNFPLRTKTIFTASAYNTAKSRLLEIANNQGYIKAEFIKSNVLVNTKTRTAIVNLKLDTKVRYFFGKLIFNKGVYDEGFLQRFNVFGPNAPFSSNRLIHYQQRLNDTTYFSQVLVSPDFDNATPDRHIPVKINVTPPKDHRYTLGIGYGTFTKARLTGGVNFRHLTDTGQSMDAQVKISSVLTGLTAKYYIPGPRPLTDLWTIGTGYQSFSPKNGKSVSRSINGGFIYNSEHWKTSTTLNYLYERYSLFTNNLPATDSAVLYPTFNTAYTYSDNLINPQKGYSFNLILQGSSQNALASTSFLQGELRAKGLYTLASWSKIVAKADIGYTVVHDLNELPLSLRFFAGGINSLRGYPDSSIGPGKYLGTAGLEYRNRIVGNWVGAVFYDTGNATDHIGDPLYQGVGVGVIYESMVGPIRVYLARAISLPDHPYQVEFSLGPEF